ncbi:hypothetical protein [Streptomyces litchfieldiae]|uniref:Uncharacterized protein n=1 Tax=Streptomyces litchfieldiae TaxID=3075543 RepID=A0ABU2N114_9ACTN|nr:hypothetical protein [Streptomyces sp. DSM 44938]MDT0346763.1 hypothetical protein [Streptomyces sp. DSM 44938]
MRYRITSPTPGARGRVAGVAFTDGRATIDDPPAGALLYFRRRGYTVEQLDDTGPPGTRKTATDDGPPGTKPAGRSPARTRRG